MKKIILSFLLLSSCTVLFAQHRRDNNNPPQTIQQAWQKDHPNQTPATWQQSNGQWHAHYKDNTSSRDADSYYDPRGRQLATHMQWDRTQLPSDYDRTIRTRYHANNYSVTRIERPNQSGLYQLIMQLTGGKTRTVYTDERGNEVRYRRTY